MINLLTVRYLGDRQFAVSFSDGITGVLDMGEYLAERKGPLLDALRDSSYLSRGFVASGALAWPNGLELAPETLHSLTVTVKDAA